MLFQRCYGEEHPDTAISYNNLAKIYHVQERYELSFSYCYKAYKILVSRFGVKHPNTQIVYENLEAAYTKCNPEGDFEQWLEGERKE